MMDHVSLSHREKVYVYFQDGYADDGDVGLETFSSVGSAVAFIERRLLNDPDRNLQMYQVIVGRPVQPEPIQLVQKVRLVEVKP